MRKIAFRVWDKVNKKMYFSYAVDKNGEWCVNSEYSNECEDVDGKQLIQMQFTGQKDKDGKKIFEGDICVSYIHPEVPIYHKIEWSEKFCGWYAQNLNSGTEDGSTQLWVYLKNDVEVIGNIHENPELLKEG